MTMAHLAGCGRVAEVAGSAGLAIAVDVGVAFLDECLADRFWQYLGADAAAYPLPLAIALIVGMLIGRSLACLAIR